MSMDERTKVVQEVSEEWMDAGRLHVPPDDTSGDEELAFWAEVDRRLAEHADST